MMSEDTVVVNMPTMVHVPETPPATALKEKEDAEPPAECRICLMDEDAHDLCSPCACQGSVRYVHTECLRKWCRERASLRCEICHHDYDLDTLAEEERSKILDALQAAQADKAVERERQRQRQQQLYGIPPEVEDDGELFEFANPHSDERAAQVRRLVMFAALVTITMFAFHTLGSILLAQHNPEGHAAETHAKTILPTDGTGSSEADASPHEDNMSPAVGRVIRVMLLFYVIRSLIFRPNHEDRSPRGGRGSDFL